MEQLTLTFKCDEDPPECALLVRTEVESFAGSLVLLSREDVSGDLSEQVAPHLPSLSQRMAAHDIVADLEHLLTLADPGQLNKLVAEPDELCRKS